MSDNMSERGGFVELGEQLDAYKTVYCYHFPEVRWLLRFVSDTIPDSMYAVTTPVERIQRTVGNLFDPPLEIPATDRGYVCLDELHVPVVERIVPTYSNLVPHLNDFGYRYPVPGSSEGIFKLLTKLKVEEVHGDSDMADGIAVLLGEYEGYKAYAGEEDLRMRVNVVDPDETDPTSIEPSYWLISNPSARDGNIMPNDFIMELCDEGHKVFLDLSYVGATEPHEFDVNHENIPAVFLSFSKPYGMFRFRMGWVLSKGPIHSLYGNKWFKKDASLLQELKLAEEIGPTELYKKYRPLQKQIIEEINIEYGLNMRASDVFLLGYITGEEVLELDPIQLALIEPFKREKTYRFCLTPYFEFMEKRGRLWGHTTK